MLSHIRLFATPWTAARQASLSTDALRMFLIFCPQWEFWFQLPSPPSLPPTSCSATPLIPCHHHPAPGISEMTCSPRVKLLCSCRVPTPEGSEKLGCVLASQLWDGDRFWNPSQNLNSGSWTLGPRSYRHMALPPRSPEDKRCHPGGTQYCILIEKSAQSQPHSARSKNANRKTYSTTVAFKKKI